MVQKDYVGGFFLKMKVRGYVYGALCTIISEYQKVLFVTSENYLSGNL